MALTKAEMIECLALRLHMSRMDAKVCVESFFAELNDILASGEDIKLSGFGNFSLREKAPRPGRNPRTGVAVTIPARRVVTFKAGRKLKSRVDKYNPN